MNQDPYEFEARVKNDNAERERTAKNKEVKKTQLPHTRLSANFKTFRQIQPNQLDFLRNTTFDQPVISLYINLSPDRLQRQKDVFLTVFNSLKHTSLQDNEAYLAELDHDSRQSVEDDLWLIQEYLQSEIDTTNARSLVMLKSGDQLQWIIAPAMPGTDYLAIDPDPYTLPLTMDLDRHRTALVVEVGQGVSEFYRYYNGNLRHLEAVKNQVPDISVDVSRPNKVQRHNQHHLQRHFKDTCSSLDKYVARYKSDNIIVLGEERTTSIFFEECLSDDKQQKVLATIPSSPGEDEGQMLARVEEVLHEKEVADVGYYLDMISREGGRDGIIKGLEEVVSAQNRHMVRTLLVDKELKQPGFFCPQDKYISTSEPECPLCGQSMDRIENVVEKLVELANQFNIDYKIVREHQGELAKFDGIAATMYEVS